MTITPKKLHWAGYWIPGEDYYPGWACRDGSWLMVCVNGDPFTNERPAPQPSGSPFYVSGLGDSPAWSVQQLTQGQVWTGLRVTFPEAHLAVSLRYWAPNLAASYGYTLIAVDPATGAYSTNVVRPQVVGWNPAPGATLQILKSGETRDLYLVTENHAGSSITNANYDYRTPNNAATPGSGDCSHANKRQDELRFHKTDDDGTDRAAMLLALKSGDLVTGDSITWTIQQVTDSGAYVTLQVTPQTQESPDGVRSFAFENFGAQPTDYVEILNHYQADPNVSGLIGSNPGDLVENDHCYGIDLELSAIQIPADWEVMSLAP